MPNRDPEGMYDLSVEQTRQATLLTKAKAGLVNMTTLAVLAWTVAGIVAVLR